MCGACEQAPQDSEELAALAAEKQKPTPSPETAPERKRKRRQRTADLSGLDFRTDITDEEVEREGKHYESELWKDL